jgi:hypothetical protein
MTKLKFFFILLQLTTQTIYAQYTPRANLKFIERNMILRPTTSKIDYSSHAKDPDSFWKGN